MHTNLPPPAKFLDRTLYGYYIVHSHYLVHTYISNRNGGLLFFIVWHRDTKCQWQVWWALPPRIIIGKERCTHWPIPWQLKFNFMVLAW